MIDLIVPTIPGREESLERCLKSFQERTDPDVLNTIAVHDSETCGGGWKLGLEQSTADYVLLACDDQMVVGPAGVWAARAQEAADAGYIVCPRVWSPEGRVESNGGDMNAYEHISKQPKRDWTPVDYTTVPFLAREAIERIGMLDIHYASDVWVSYRGRQLGYTTVIRHGFDIVHFQEAVGRGAGMGQGERDQMDCATMREELEQLEAVEAGVPQ